MWLLNARRLRNEETRVVSHFAPLDLGLQQSGAPLSPSLWSSGFGSGGVGLDPLGQVRLGHVFLVPIRIYYTPVAVLKILDPPFVDALLARSVHEELADLGAYRESPQRFFPSFLISQLLLWVFGRSRALVRLE